MPTMQSQIESRDLFGKGPIPEMNGGLNGRFFAEIFVEGPRAAGCLAMLRTVFRGHLPQSAINDLYDGLGGRISASENKKGRFITCETSDILDKFSKQTLEESIRTVAINALTQEQEKPQWWLPDSITALSFTDSQEAGIGIHIATLTEVQ